MGVFQPLLHRFGCARCGRQERRTHARAIGGQIDEGKARAAVQAVVQFLPFAQIVGHILAQSRRQGSREGPVLGQIVAPLQGDGRRGGGGAFLGQRGSAGDERIGLLPHHDQRERNEGGAVIARGILRSGTGEAAGQKLVQPPDRALVQVRCRPAVDLRDALLVQPLRAHRHQTIEDIAFGGQRQAHAGTPFPHVDLPYQHIERRDIRAHQVDAPAPGLRHPPGHRGGKGDAAHGEPIGRKSLLPPGHHPLRIQPQAERQIDADRPRHFAIVQPGLKMGQAGGIAHQAGKALQHGVVDVDPAGRLRALRRLQLRPQGARGLNILRGRARLARNGGLDAEEQQARQHDQAGQPQSGLAQAGIGAAIHDRPLTMAWGNIQHPV